jgi:hypothetical protein
MTNLTIAHRRLHNQLITHHPFDNPADVVRWLGAIQAQDYPSGLWAIGLRIANATQSTVEQAITDRTIVRTWPMRGTIHFVPAEDVRWLLELLTPRIVKNAASRFRQLDLDDATFSRSKDLFINVLQGGKQLSRPAMYQVLESAGISAAGQRGNHILFRLAQERLICFASHQGKQPAFALLDEWVPPGKTLSRYQALAELATRYFTSHGPATLQDFIWWSGLPAAPARAALESVKSQLTQDTIDGQTYWLSPSTPSAPKLTSPTAHLLPPFDEYTVAYRDRSAVIDPAYAQQLGFGILGPVIVVDGRVVGTWKRADKKTSVSITTQPFTPLSDAENYALTATVERYSHFRNLPVTLA